MSLSPVRVVIQARLGASRLPGKTLLPLGRMPAIALCGRRAANRGHDVRVATTISDWDDLVAAAANQAGLPVTRGAEQDVLSRYATAAEDLPDEAIIVRLTADNMFPDGAFVEEIVTAFRNERFDYLAPIHPGSGLPYGVAAEVMTAAALRKAALRAVTSEHREHVGSWLERHGQAGKFFPSRAHAGWSELRATIDYLEDYERIARIFASEVDPVSAPWWELCDRLAELAKQKPRPRPRPVLGLANLGLESYGRTSAAGRLSTGERTSLLRSAIRLGIDAVDAARAYGAAERMAGEVLFARGANVEITTKLDPTICLGENASAGEIEARIEASVYRSCSELGLRSLPVLLLHDAAQLTLRCGIVWEKLLSLRKEGIVRELGASLYAPDELEAALAAPSLTHLQIPINILDRRWSRAQAPQRIRRHGKVIVTARSIFLQGLLCAPASCWPRVPGTDAAILLRAVGEMAAKLERSGVADLCLAYVRTLPWVDRIVFAVDSEGQLDELLQLWATPPLTAEACEYLESNLPEVPSQMVDPRAWKSMSDV